MIPILHSKYLFCSTEISLQQRLEYIARAILSAKSSTTTSSIAADGEFLHELEEKMEVRKSTYLSYIVSVLLHLIHTLHMAFLLPNL